jgi:hypothetical protein
VIPYGAIPLDFTNSDEYFIPERLERRWSLVDKFDDTQLSVCRKCCRFVNCKCMLATFLLIFFIWCTYFVAGIFLFTKDRPAYVDSFDYIIVGAGPSGSVVTKRLADAGHKILLLGMVHVCCAIVVDSHRTNRGLIF